MSCLSNLKTTAFIPAPAYRQAGTGRGILQHFRKSYRRIVTGSTKQLLELLFAMPDALGLPSNAADIVRAALIVAQHIGAVKHHDPCRFRVALEGRGGPVGQVVPKGDLFADGGSSI